MMDKLFETERITGKRVLITGGTSGIGKALAIRLSALGARILIVGRHKNTLKDTLDSIEDRSRSQVWSVIADISKHKHIEKVFATLSNKLGGLDILINNAGLGHGSITEGEYNDWEYVVKTNVMGYLACSHYALSEMIAQGSGHIIHIGSMSADDRGAGGSVYVATKTAIQGFSESLRKEVNPKGINVTLIEPGAVDTDMQELSQQDKDHRIANLEMLMADDIAQSVVYVLSQSERTSIVELKIKPLKQII